MKNPNIVFIGMDTHKETTDVSYIKDGFGEEAHYLGKFPSRKQAMVKLVKQLQSKFSGATLYFTYEAGPCGFWLYRLLMSLGQECFIVAPSLIPKKPGERVKTDKRDSLLLARLLKSGDLKGIYVPAAEDEAIRDLSRARERAMRDLNDARFQLKALLLRNHINYKGKANWSVKHMRWLCEIILPHSAQQIVLQEAIQTVCERQSRLDRLDNELTYHVKKWRYYPVVKSIQAMRGVAQLVAVGVIAELGDLTRFDHPSKLMSYVGVTPGEHSSGERRRTGAITKCGNTRARRLLVEGANSYRYEARVSTDMQKRQESVSKEVIDIAWQAQLRLCKRYQYLHKRGKNQNVIKVAIAREMIATIWQIAREVPLRPPEPSIIRMPVMGGIKVASLE
jgi:transposase